MEINQIILNDNQFRFSLYKKNQSEQYVIFFTRSFAGYRIC